MNQSAFREHCGAALPPDASFCETCGTPVAAPVGSASAPTSSPSGECPASNRNRMLIAGAVVGIIAVCVIGIPLVGCNFLFPTGTIVSVASPTLTLPVASATPTRLPVLAQVTTTPTLATSVPEIVVLTEVLQQFDSCRIREAVKASGNTYSFSCSHSADSGYGVSLTRCDSAATAHAQFESSRGSSPVLCFHGYALYETFEVNPYNRYVRVESLGWLAGAWVVSIHASYDYGYFHLNAKSFAEAVYSSGVKSGLFLAGTCPTTSTATPGPTSRPASNEERFFEVWSKGAVYNGATAPTTFSTTQSWRVTELVTYHWNDRKGMTPGTIGLKAADGTTYGPWTASGVAGQAGVPNAVWVVKPDVVIPPGNYSVLDSDPSTWSQNSDTRGAGMAYGTGISVVAPRPP